jgi:hypothetical protein
LVVRADCAKRLDEVLRAMPTIVFDVKDRDGHAVTDVSVTMDGAALGRVDGSAITVDPGQHEFTFLRGGEVVATKKIGVPEGLKIGWRVSGWRRPAFRSDLHPTSDGRSRASRLRR